MHQSVTGGYRRTGRDYGLPILGGGRMSLDVSLTVEVCSLNITHNLNLMAEEAGIYRELWRPDEINIEYAHQLIEPLSKGLEKLKSDPEYYKQFNPENGWGDYNNLVKFVTEYLRNCILFPGSSVSVDR